MSDCGCRIADGIVDFGLGQNCEMMAEDKSMPVLQPVVLVENVYKSYRRGSQEISVLRGIHLSIAEGNFVALMGPSGSGKTTLLNLIAGIDRPDEGRLIIAGTDITALGEVDLARWRAHHVGFVFQFYNLLPVLTGLENVELPLLLRDLNRKQRREHAMLALELVGLQRPYAPLSARALRRPAATGGHRAGHCDRSRHSSWPTNQRETWTRPRPPKSWPFWNS